MVTQLAMCTKTNRGFTSRMVMQLAMCAKTNQGLDRGFAWISGSLTRNILSLESGNAIKMD